MTFFKYLFNVCICFYHSPFDLLTEQKKEWNLGWCFHTVADATKYIRRDKSATRGRNQISPQRASFANLSLFVYNLVTSGPRQLRSQQANRSYSGDSNSNVSSQPPGWDVTVARFLKDTSWWKDPKKSRRFVTLIGSSFSKSPTVSRVVVSCKLGGYQSNSIQSLVHGYLRRLLWSMDEVIYKVMLFTFTVILASF